mmetsp:Transcript_47058/g.152748  ORF Transcript_47058/g.152748 Transcript_47058/m.152748 type:complete len:97 (-) Transcript_47058:216-506(-)
MVELLGRMPRKLSASGTHAKDFFNKAGELRNIKKLKPWGLADVLADKYDFARAEAQALADFILPMLDFDPSKRATAAQMLAHPWLSEAAPALDECD